MIEAKHILVKQLYEAEDLLRKLKAGEKFEDLAREYSLCPSSKSGGNLGPFSRGDMVPEFEEAAFSLKTGEVSGAVRTQFGVHLILRVK